MATWMYEPECLNGMDSLRLELMVSVLRLERLGLEMFLYVSISSRSVSCLDSSTFQSRSRLGLGLFFKLKGFVSSRTLTSREHLC